MDEKNLDANVHFVSLVMMLASACWQQLGKVPNPVSGKTEMELEHARITIELLTMLRDKTRGNLTVDEDQMLTNTISDLQLNYADEVSRQQKTVN